MLAKLVFGQKTCGNRGTEVGFGRHGRGAARSVEPGEPVELTRSWQGRWSGMTIRWQQVRLIVSSPLRNGACAVEQELYLGRKASHWMWFIFPQIAGLGSSPLPGTSRSPTSMRRAGTWRIRFWESG